MKRAPCIILILASLLLLISGCKSLFTLDLPPGSEIDSEKNWTMLGRNLKRQHFTHNNINPPLDVVWQRRMKSVIADHPLAVGNVIFAPTKSGIMYMLDYDTGETIGNMKLGLSIKGSPAIQQNTMYAGLTMGSETLLRFDMKSGKKELNQFFPHISTSPLVWENKVYFGTDRNLFFCANRHSGISIWQYVTEAPVNSSPSLVSPHVIFGDDKGWLYALDASSGVELWKTKLDGSIFSHPVLDDSVVYIGTVSGKLYGIDIVDGSIIWMKSFDGAIYSSPALFGNVLYLGNNAHEIVALHKQGGETIWTFKTEGIVNTVPLPSPDYLYATSWDKNLYVLNRFSGKLVFKYDLKHPAKSSPIIYRDYLLIHTANHNLIALSSEKFVQDWRNNR